MLKLWIEALAVGLIVFAMTSVSEASNYYASADDDVFVDEGDGDFDTTPIPPQAAEKPAPKKAAPKAAPADQAAESAQVPVEAPVAKKQEKAPAPIAAKSEPKAEPEFKPAPSQPEQAALPATEDLFPKAEEKAKPEPKKAVAAAPAAPSKKAARQPASKYAKGMYATTKSSCTMHREPANDAPKMLTVKPAKKIWVEKVDDNWVRGFNKAGEGGFIAKDCLE